MDASLHNNLLQSPTDSFGVISFSEKNVRSRRVQPYDVNAFAVGKAENNYNFTYPTSLGLCNHIFFVTDKYHLLDCDVCHTKLTSRDFPKKCVLLRQIDRKLFCVHTGCFMSGVQKKLYIKQCSIAKESNEIIPHLIATQFMQSGLVELHSAPEKIREVFDSLFYDDPISNLKEIIKDVTVRARAKLILLAHQNAIFTDSEAIFYLGHTYKNNRTIPQVHVMVGMNGLLFSRYRRLKLSPEILEELINYQKEIGAKLREAAERNPEVSKEDYHPAASNLKEVIRDVTVPACEQLILLANQSQIFTDQESQFYLQMIKMPQLTPEHRHVMVGMNGFLYSKFRRLRFPPEIMQELNKPKTDSMDLRPTEMSFEEEHELVFERATSLSPEPLVLQIEEIPFVEQAEEGSPLSIPEQDSFSLNSSITDEMPSEEETLAYTEMTVEQMVQSSPSPNPPQANLDVNSSLMEFSKRVESDKGLALSGKFNLRQVVQSDDESFTFDTKLGKCKYIFSLKDHFKLLNCDFCNCHRNYNGMKRSYVLMDASTSKLFIAHLRCFVTQGARARKAIRAMDFKTCIPKKLEKQYIIGKIAEPNITDERLNEIRNRVMDTDAISNLEKMTVDSTVLADAQLILLANQHKIFTPNESIFYLQTAYKTLHTKEQTDEMIALNNRLVSNLSQLQLPEELKSRLNLTDQSFDEATLAEMLAEDIEADRETKLSAIDVSFIENI